MARDHDGICSLCHRAALAPTRWRGMTTEYLSEPPFGAHGFVALRVDQLRRKRTKFTLPHQFIKKLRLTGSTIYGYSDLWSSVRAFGLGSASCRGTKRPQTQSNDLHSRLSSTFPEVPPRSAERSLASPFLTSPTKS